MDVSLLPKHNTTYPWEAPPKLGGITKNTGITSPLLAIPWLLLAKMLAVSWKGLLEIVEGKHLVVMHL